MTHKLHPVQEAFLARFDAAPQIMHATIIPDAPFVTKAGFEVLDKVYQAPKSAYRLVQACCTRCNGQGGADAWKHTGWTCYKCGGDGGHHMARETVYDRAAFAKRQAKADARRDAKLAAEAAKKATAKATFSEAHAELIAKVNQITKPSAFLCDIMSKGYMFGSISSAQAAAAHRAADIELTRQGENQKCDFVGTVGEKITFTGTIVFHTAFDGAFGTVHVMGVKTDDGNMIIQKGSSLKRRVKRDGERFYYGCEKGDRVTVKATVKAHTIRDGVKQTMIERPTVLSVE